MTKVYIAGPMTGLPDFNYPSFHEAGDYLEEHGFEVRSGAHSVNFHTGVRKATPPSVGSELSHEDYLRTTLKQLLGCDLIYLLDGWADSKGARLEVQVAKAIGLKTISLQNLK